MEERQWMSRRIQLRLDVRLWMKARAFSQRRPAPAPGRSARRGVAARGPPRRYRRADDDVRGPAREGAPWRGHRVRTPGTHSTNHSVAREGDRCNQQKCSSQRALFVAEQPKRCRNSKALSSCSLSNQSLHDLQSDAIAGDSSIPEGQKLFFHCVTLAKVGPPYPQALCEKK